MEVKVGSKLRNNDPRYAGQVVEVITITESALGKFATYQGGRRRCKVRLDRIVTDPKQMTYNKGWSLIDPNGIDVA
jgi:hypothetical protein